MERNYTKIQWSKFLYKILMRALHLSTGGIPEGLFYKWRNISPSVCCCLSLVPCNDCVRTETYRVLRTPLHVTELWTLLVFVLAVCSQQSGDPWALHPGLGRREHHRGGEGQTGGKGRENQASAGQFQVSPPVCQSLGSDSVCVWNCISQIAYIPGSSSWQWKQENFKDLVEIEILN